MKKCCECKYWEKLLSTDLMGICHIPKDMIELRCLNTGDNVVDKCHVLTAREFGCIAGKGLSHE